MPAKLFGAAAEFIERKYGGGMADTDAVVSVGVTQGLVLRPDPERVSVLLVNLSVNSTYVGFDERVSADRGILLASNGGNYSVNVEEDFTLPIRPMYALSTGANSNLYVVTVRRISKIQVEAV